MGFFNFFKKKNDKIYNTNLPKSIKSKIKKYELKPYEVKKTEAQKKYVHYCETIGDSFSLTKDYLDALERFIPIVSASIWTWKNICNTNIDINLIGKNEKQKKLANEILLNLNKKINPFKSAKNGGFNHLMNIWFEHYFKYGRFSGELKIDFQKYEIEKFEIFNPFHIRFMKNYDLVLFKGNFSYQLNPNTSYYYAQNMDISNPYGVSMFESTPFLIQINDDLMRDMSNSSSNAGTPRLHFKIDKPEIMDREDPKLYFNRANTYFDDTVDELKNVGSDENFFTWKELDIETTGADGRNFVFKLNRQVVDEEIITATRLYPWVLAKSFGNTKNFVQVQFDLLMNEADSVQLEASNFLNWIIKTEFLLQGITKIEPQVKFTRMRDPKIKEIAETEEIKFNTTIRKIETGAISEEDGARLLKLEKWYDKSRIERKKDLSKL